MKSAAIWIGVVVALGICLPGSAKEIRYNRDIRPILSDKCFFCHGPDPETREADLRLDTADGLAGAVVMSDLDSSELIRRIESRDADEVMPPPDAHKPLSTGQRDVLKQWVAEGAAIEDHWAFVPPRRAETPGRIDSPANRRRCRLDRSTDSLPRWKAADHTSNRGRWHRRFGRWRKNERRV